MQESSMNWVQSGEIAPAFQKALQNDKLLEQQNMYEWAAEEVRKATTNLPEGMRTPTAQEIAGMEQFAVDYRKKKPKASNREIRRATQRKFGIKILPNT